MKQKKIRQAGRQTDRKKNETDRQTDTDWQNK